MTGTVYLLHFLRKYRWAGHYVGWTSDLNARLEQHRKGQGARLLQVIQAAGIEWILARTWEGKKRSFERNLKKRKFGIIGDLCPICLGESPHVVSLPPAPLPPEYEANGPTHVLGRPA